MQKRVEKASAKKGVEKACAKKGVEKACAKMMLEMVREPRVGGDVTTPA